MEIWDAKGNKVLDSVVTQNAEHVEEMMQSDYVSLQWVSNVKRVLPAGAYIIPFDDGVRYMLLDPYTPDQNNTDEFTYSPQFQHPKMYLGKVPYTRASKDTEGNDINLLEWDYKGYLTTFLSDLCEFITKTFTDEGITTDKFSYSILGDIEDNITFSISNNDILSVLSNVCNTLDCEWHIDWEQRRLYLGNIRFDKNEGSVLELTSGVNVGMASVSSQRDTHFNVYLPQGSTRNMAAATTDGSYYATNRRLELDTEKYPDGKIYTDGKGNVVTKAQFLETGLPKLVQTLMLDEIYPKIDLYVYDVRNRERYLLDDNGEKVIDHYEGETPVYKRYAIWYMRLAYPIYNTNGTIRSWKDATLGDTFKLIDGYTLMCSFGANTDSTLTSPLAGREFELNYVETDKEAKELSAKADSDKGDTGVEVKKGDYEIIYTTEGNLIIPTTEEQGLVPKGDSSPSKNGNKVTIFNVVMGEDFIKAAQNDLEVAAIREIKKQYSDLNQYTFNSDNVAFKKDMPSLYIGRSVRYNDGVGNTLETRIMKLTTKLDFPFMVEITVGNKVLKGSTSQLKTDVQMILSGNRQTASNGITESVVRSLIKGFGGANFLSKVNDDTARGIITFLQGTNWGNFTSETGAAMTIDPATGQTYMEVDRLKVRLKAFFEQLEVQKVGYVGGKIVVSKGQGVDILDVEEIYDSEGNLSAYRCYFLGEQEGRRINNLLRVDDQMICKDENISEGSTDGATNKYYWRLVTAVSSDVVKRGNNVCHWVDLSATDYDTNSDIPSVGDTICQLGNRNDIDRQGAEVLSVVDANSPSFTIYAGINSYSLVNKEYIDMGVSEGKAYCNIYGSTYIGDRERKTGYLRWNDDTKTFEIKGTIDISSPLSSGGTIGGAIDNAANAYKDDFSSFTSNVNEIIGGFQAQIDGVIETWFFDPAPTLGNPPASEWKDNTTKDKHLGDLYYSKAGKAYRFQKEGDNYVWVEIMDTDITTALKEAKEAKDAAAAAQGTADTAQNTAKSKMKVFVNIPTNSDEYSIGDMWVNATYPADGSTYNNEILHCVTDKAAGEAFSISHWAQSSNIKTQFNNFVNNTYTEDKKDFYNQLDGKVETWYQPDDPKNKWVAADYSKHTGDIWYNGSTNKAYRWTGTAWVELKDQAAIDAKALAESKRRVFTTTTLPTPPYDEKDLWVQGENGDIMVCVTPKAAGATASASDWAKASKYTDDSALNTFINEYKAQIADFSQQLDGKIETWYYPYVPETSNAPASKWTADEKTSHSGDLFYNTATGVAYRWTGTAWEILKDKEVQTALNNAKTAQDTADNKRRVFLSQPTVPYDAGDLWVSDTANGKVTKVCVNGKTTGTFSTEDWKESDDAALNSFSSTITKSIEGIESQLDKKAETWYQAADPSTAWTTANLKKEHVGDLWYNTTNSTTWYYNGTEWVQQNVPTEVFDKIDGKAAIYVSKPSSYRVNDLWILEAAYTLSGVLYTKGTLVVATATSDTFNAAHWTEKVKYTDDTKANEALTKVGDLQTDVTELGDSFETLTDVTLPALSDGIITTSEKENIRQALMQVQKECVDVINAYTNLTVNYKSIYDKIAADVRTDFTTAYTNLMGSATLSSDGTITYTSGQGGAYGALVDNINALLDKKGNLTNNEIATINNNIANFNIKYNDFQNRLVVVRNDIEKTLDTRITEVDEQLGGYAYLKKIVGGKTTIDGGLVLTTMLGTGYEVTGGAYKIMSGISGLYETAKSVAIWAGGSMIDKFVYYDAENKKFNVPDDVNPANFLVRMDGTGYAAGGNFWWDNDGKIHADPQSFIINEQYVGNIMQLFELHYREAGKTDFTNVDYVTPTRMFNGLELSDKGLQIGDTAKLYIKNGVLFIEGDLAVTGGITMYASDGVKSGMIDQVYAVLDQSIFSIKDGVITITGEIGSGTVKGITINSTKYDPDNNGIIALTLNWGDLTGVPTTFTPSAHNHDDLYYIKSDIDTKLAGKSNTGHTHDDRYYTESEMDTMLGGKSDTSHTHSLKINGVTKIIEATGGTAVDLGTYLTVHQPIYALTINGTGTNTFTYIPNSSDAALTITPAWIGAPTTSGTGATGTWGISISGNAATATKLAATKTLWGQSFDGSANVSGNMSSVGSITPTGDTLKIVGNLVVTGGITMYATDGTFDSAFGQQLANFVDNVTIKFVNDKLVAVNNGNVTSIIISGTEYKPTDGAVTLPDLFAPSAHKHAIADVNGLQDILSKKLDASLKGAANGLATLDASGKVPSAQLPSYVDDVLEYTNKASFPSTGESGKIYIDKATNLTYRWGGTSYVEISQSLALGETSSTAYAGDKGKKNATDIAALKTGKADKATTLAGYGITDAYTKTQTYTKTEVDTKLTDGSVTKVGTANVGATNIPIYLKAGVPTAVTLVDTANNLINNLSTGTSTPVDADYYVAQYVGGGTTTTTFHRRPHSALYAYIKGKAEGTWAISISGNAATASKLGTATVGSGTQHLYLNGGTATASTSTVGGTAKPMYLNAGVMTAISATVGSTSLPVYLNAGTITACSTTLGVSVTGNAATATTLQTARTLWGQSFNGSANISGNMSGVGQITFSALSGTNGRALLYQQMADNDYFRIYCGGTGNNGGYAEIATADDGTEPIYVRQYSGVFSSVVRTLTLLDGNGNTTVPGLLTAANGTVNGTLKVGAIPVTNSSTGVLKIDGNLIVTGGITMYATDGVASGLMEQILVDGVTIDKDANGRLYAINTGNVRSIVMGSTTYTPNSSGVVTLPEKVTWANIEGKPSTFTPSSHTHAISQITNLQATLDGKAAASHTHSYLPLSGGTISNNTRNLLLIKNTNSTGLSTLWLGGAFDTFSQGAVVEYDGNTGALHLSNFKAYINNSHGIAGFRITADNKIQCGDANYMYNVYDMLHTGNYNDYAPTKTGSGASGTWGINISGNAATATNANMVEGYHISNIYTSIGDWIGKVGNNTVITVDGDANTYYPVVIESTFDKTAPNFISVWKNLGSKTAAYPENHPGGTSSLWLMFEGRSCVWDGDGGYYRTIYKAQGYATLVAEANMVYSSVSVLCVYLRGGGTEYNISASYRASVNVYYSETNLADSTYPAIVSPRTSIGNGGIINGRFYGDATYAYNSDTCDGLHVHSGRNNEANKIVRTDGSGYIQCGYINSSSGDEGNNSSPARVWGTNGSDSYMRTYLTSALSVNYASNAGTASYANYLNSNTRMEYGWSGLNYFNANLTAGCTAKTNDAPVSEWWHIMRFNHGNPAGYYTDLAIPFNSDSLYWKCVRVGSLAHTSWVKVLDSLNYNEYAPTKTGTGASGTWGISISGNSETSIKASYARGILGRNTSGGDFGASDDNIVISEWNTYSDNRWYLKAKGYECRVGYANSAGNADTLDGYHANSLFVKSVDAYGIENLCTGVNSGGNNTVSGGVITTKGDNVDTYFNIITSEPIESGQTYTFGFYVSDWPVGTVGSWAFGVGSQSNDFIVKISGNGWTWATGKINEAIGSNQVLIDDVIRTAHPIIKISKIVLVKGSVFPYYTPPISQMSVRNAATASKWATARTLTLTGSVTGSVSIDGSGNVSLATTTNHTHAYLPLSGGTMTGTINANDNVQNTGIKFKSNNANLNALSNQHLILGTAIRFGAYNTWDWNVWAGLKYDSSSKTIYLGLADGTIFGANSAQSGGTLKFPGVSEIYLNSGARISHGGSLYFGRSDNSGWLYFQDMASQNGTSYWMLTQAGYLTAKGVTLSEEFTSTVSSGTYLDANDGKAIINSTAAAGFNMLARMKSTNGVFIHGMHSNAYKFYYTADGVISEGTNEVSESLLSLGEDGYVSSNNLVPLSNAACTFGLSSNRWIRGFFSNALHVGAANSTATNAVANCSQFGPGYIELSHSTPFIDFHYNKNKGNYTSRIVATSASCLAITSNLYIGGSGDTSYKLRVAGQTYIEGALESQGTFVVLGSAGPVAKIDQSGNITANGGITMYSDLRKKNILSNEVLSVKEIAAAPLFRHTYKSDDNQYIHVGTSAQYWSGIHEDWFTRKDDEGYYQMELQNLGVAMGISLAREIVTLEGAFKKYESKTDKKIRLMKKKINDLEARIKELEGSREERRTA